MEENKKSINEFINKLKTIDVGDLLEKAQTIKIEDLRSLKWNDLSNSKLFFPILGIFLAISSTLLIFIPSYRKLSSIQVESKLYINETKQLASLQKNLEDSLFIRNKLIEKTMELKSLVINNKNLINIPRIFNESAEMANINLIEIRPISKDSIACSYSEQEIENIKPTQKNYISKRNSINQNLFLELEKNKNKKSNLSIPVDHKKLKPSNKRLQNLFSFPINDIDAQFNSNFYLLSLESSYLESLDFLKYLQEYKVSILPICFEPKGFLADQNSQEFNTNEERFKNKINIRLIINVPTN